MFNNLIGNHILVHHGDIYYIFFAFDLFFQHQHHLGMYRGRLQCRSWVRISLVSCACFRQTGETRRTHTGRTCKFLTGSPEIKPWLCCESTVLTTLRLCHQQICVALLLNLLYIVLPYIEHLLIVLLSNIYCLSSRNNWSWSHLHTVVKPGLTPPFVNIGL